MSRLNRALLTMALLATACYKDDASGPLHGKPMAKILITDDPFPYDSLNSVDMYIVSIAASTEPDTGSSADNMSWVTIAEPRKRVNLLDLQQGKTSLLGEGELPADQYRAIRVVINTDSSRIIYSDRQAVVQWGGAGEQAIHAFVESPVAVPDSGADIVIDFDLGRSFRYDGASYTFSFIPWIRAVNQAETGSIAGTITTTIDTFKLKNAVISAWRGNVGEGPVLSTGRTDSSGHYRIAYLLPGRYIVQVEGPTSVSSAQYYATDLDSNVVVTRGGETTHNVALSLFTGDMYIRGASSMLVNHTNQLEAIVVNAHHEQDTTATVVWQNLDTAILGLRDSLRFAYVTSKAVGSGRIVATSGSLADTLTIFVAPDSSSH